MIPFQFGPGATFAFLGLINHYNGMMYRAYAVKGGK